MIELAASPALSGPGRHRPAPGWVAAAAGRRPELDVDPARACTGAVGPHQHGEGRQGDSRGFHHHGHDVDASALNPATVKFKLNHWSKVIRAPEDEEEHLCRADQLFFIRSFSRS